MLVYYTMHRFMKTSNYMGNISQTFDRKYYLKHGNVTFYEHYDHMSGKASCKL